MSGKKEVLFIHEGKECDTGANKVLLMPMGLIAMVDFLQQNGINSTIIHMPIERSLDANFDIISKISKYNPKIICFDLHWHQQLPSVLDLAKQIKSEHPDRKIVIGGYTSSFFYKELMKDFNQIDYIIRGDSELPLLELAKGIISGSSNVKNIPNLVYKEDGKTVANDMSYCVTAEILGKLNFSNFEMIDHYNMYAAGGLFEGKISSGQGEAVFFYNCGRGCPYNCPICGGSKISQKIISNRKQITYAPIDSVVRNLKNLAKYNIDVWYNTFDPSPEQSYFVKLFEEIRKNNISLNLRFECLHIPTKEFIDATIKTFKSVRLDFVLQTGSDRLRRLVKGNFYGNKELVDVLVYLEKNGVNVDLCFVAGLPFETTDDIIKTLTFINFVKNRFKRVNIVSTTLEMEPASPWHLESEKYHITNFRKDLSDFIDQHRKKSDLGYRTENFSGEDIYLIKKLYLMESRCKEQRSRFLQVLLDDLFASHLFKLESLQGHCKSCKHYDSCTK